MDAGRERRGRGRAGPALRPGPPGRRPPLAGQGDAEDGASIGPFEVVEETARGGARRAGATRARSTTCRRSARRSPRDSRRARTPTSTASSPGTRSARTRGPASSTSRPGCGAEDFQLGQVAGAAGRSRRSTRSGRYHDGFGWLSRRDAPRRRRGDHRRPRAARLLLPPRAVHPPLPALLAVQHAAPVPARRRVVHLHGPGLRQAALGADARRRSTRASATRSWRSSTGSGGSRTSATSGSSTGSSTCTTG